jgi:hypothetical protein
MLQVNSARVTYSGPDRLDVTRKSGREGLFLAPSWRILGPALQARATDGVSLEQHWRPYRDAYIQEMRESWAARRVEWDALLARERVALVCYCADAERCHRAILRAEILPKLGALDCGELTPAQQARARIVAAVERSAARS